MANYKYINAKMCILNVISCVHNLIWYMLVDSSFSLTLTSINVCGISYVAYLYICDSCILLTTYVDSLAQKTTQAMFELHSNMLWSSHRPGRSSNGSVEVVGNCGISRRKQKKIAERLWWWWFGTIVVDQLNYDYSQVAALAWIFTYK